MPQYIDVLVYFELLLAKRSYIVYYNTFIEMHKRG